ncbi:AAA family ATPase [Nocardia aurantiaca]|uniref:AAA family ATPase n=1 Tax=Nocardia aurantiaca TaxID=2675850 RepID=UPI002E1DBB6E
MVGVAVSAEAGPAPATSRPAAAAAIPRTRILRTEAPGNQTNLRRFLTSDVYHSFFRGSNGYRLRRVLRLRGRIRARILADDAWIKIGRCIGHRICHCRRSESHTPLGISVAGTVSDIRFVYFPRVEVACVVHEIRVLQGREREQAELSRILSEARAGRGGGLLLWGEPGIGKTALLRDSELRAADFRVVICRGFPAESELDFAALRELLLSLTDRITALPGPQARALAAALGRETGRVDRFLVGAALVTLLAAVARERPVLLIVDDAHWVDLATAQALTFALRRLSAHRVALLAAMRECPATSVWQALPMLRVAPLSDAPARRLLALRSGGIGAPREARMLRLADGNPLALREFPIDSEDGAGIGWGPMRFGPRLRAAFADRLAALDEPVRILLTVVAAEDRGTLSPIVTAATELGVTAADWESALAAGLLSVTDGRIEMRHRLLCGAAYDAASRAQRRAVHVALADALQGSENGDLRTWHLAAVLDGPNPALAQALADGAERVRARAGALAAAAVLRRAAAITPDPDAAGVRLATAARFAWAGGDIESARHLLALAATRIPPAEVAAASGGLSGLLEFVTGDPAKAHILLLRDADAIAAPLPPSEIAAAEPDSACLGGGADLAAGLRLLADRAAWSVGRAADLPLAGQLEAVAAASSPIVAAHLLPPAGQLLEWGLAERALEPYLKVAGGLRNSRDRPAALGVLPQLAVVQFATGRWEAGETTLAEAFELATGAGADNILAHCWNLRARLAAQRGDGDVVADSVDRALSLSRPHAVSVLTGGAYWHHGFHALTAGDAESAYRRLRALSQPGHEAAHPTMARLATLDMVEAACRVGRFDEAAEYAELIAAWARRSRARWALSAAYSCRALLADEDRAERYYRRALAVGDTRHTSFGRARTQLLYGKWLRRVRRRADAAEQLRTAAEAFDLIGATAWAARSRTELELTGTGAKSGGAGATPLTAQESQVAKLAAQGLTNREIGAELFLSPRTVGHHMSRILEKLGLTSRSELRGIDFDNGMRLSGPH